MFRSSIFTSWRKPRSNAATQFGLKSVLSLPCFRRLRLEPLEARDLLTATISGRVWLDANADGSQAGAAEPNVQYAIVELILSTDGIYGNGDDLLFDRRKITDANGVYQFPTVTVSNQYFVVVRSPLGYTYTTQFGTPDTALDSDVNSIGVSNLITPIDGTTTTIDAGLVGATPGFGWAQTVSTAGVDEGYDVALDSAGSVYVTGSFSGAVDMDPGPGVWNLASNGGTDIFVAKYSALGALAWARSAGGTGDDVGRNIAVNSGDGAYIAGSFRNQVEFSPGLPSYTLTSAGSADAFVWKLSPEGTDGYVRRAGGVGSDEANAIDVLGGQVAITGFFSGTVDFDPGASTSNLVADGASDAFVWKLNNSGNFSWAVHAGTPGAEFTTGNSLRFDSAGNIVVAGSFPTGSADFDPGAGVSNLTAVGLDAFVWKLSSTGGLVWAKNAGGSSTDGAYAITVGASNSIISTGMFTGTVDFDPAGSVANLTANGSSADIFVWKLDSAGNYVWAKSAGGNDVLDQGLAIAVDASDNVVLTGDFQGTGDFDPGPGISNLTSAGNTDAFVWKLNSGGNLVFARKIGASSGDSGRGIAVDNSGVVRATGHFVGTADFDPTASTQNLTGPGSQDAYLLRWDVGATIDATVSGRIWQDANSDGIQTAGEANSQYAVVELMNSVNGVIGDSDDVSFGTRITAADGAYSFTGVAAGSPYYIMLRPPVGFSFTTQDVGSDDAIDSDVSSIGRTALFTPADGASIDLDAGLVGSAQAFGWATSLASPGSAGNAITVDAAGNTYVTGFFGTTFDVDPGPGTVNLTGAGGTDIFVAKYTAGGALVWGVRAGTNATDEGRAIAVDTGGNVLVTGSYTGPVDFDPSSATATLPGRGDADIFVWKLTADGRYVWAKGAGSDGSDAGAGIVADSNGAVWITGTFRESFAAPYVDFDPSGATYWLSALGTLNAFVWRLDSSGNFMSATSVAVSGGSATGKGLALDNSENLIVTGEFSSGTADFDPGPGVYPLTAGSSGVNSYVWKLSPTGSLVWAKQVAAATDAVAVAANGDIVTTGFFYSTADFDPGTGVANLVSNPSGIHSLFVWKLTSDGNYSWAKTPDTIEYGEEVTGIAIGPSGNVVVTGFFPGTMDFDTGPGVYNLTSGGMTDIFVWELSPAGELVFARNSGSVTRDEAHGVAVDASGNVRLTGVFRNSGSLKTDLDPGPGVQQFGTTTFNPNGFVLNWNGPYLSDTAPTALSLSPTTILENAGAGAVVGTLTSIDPDANESFGYSLVAGAGSADNSTFSISTNHLIANTSLNYEAKSTYSIRLRTTDAVGQFVEQTFTINVQDVNEPPTFTKGSDQTIDENSGLQSVPGWATGITTGGESGQSLTFTATVDPAWSSYAGGPQHTAVSQAPSQSLSTIRWQTPMDLNPQYSGELLLAHYGSPLISAANTVIIPVKTGATSGFKVEARNGANGTLKWTQTTDYIMPPHNWVPSYAPTLTPRGRLYYAGAGGTIFYTDNVDSNSPSAPVRLAFYGLSEYNANAATYNSSVFINTPITSDAAGNIYFGFQVTGANPLGLASGIARIAPDGTATYTSTTTASGDAGLVKVAMNAAPAMSNDGSTLYVVVSSGNNGRGALLALNSTTLAQIASRPLVDPNNGNNARINDNGTSSPTVGPDGDVYIGVLENPSGSNHYRGWLLHFSGNLAQSKPAGAFGWDITPSVVPASMVPSYTGSSSYLVMTKYNHYAGAGGDGVNKLAILDPNSTMVDPVTGATVMQEVLTIAGPTPDVDILSQYPNAVREWCINTAVVDPSTGSVLVNSEDGKLYRWNLATNTFTESIVLTAGLGQAYTPTLLGPDGTVYAINDAKLFAVGAASPPAFSGFFSVPPSVDPATGTLTYQVAPNVYGSARVTLTLSDNGGMANGGLDTSAPQSLVITSAPTELRVTKVTPNATGFVAEFNRTLNPSELSLYEQDGLLGAADVTLSGNATGPVQGSLVVDAGLKQITFIKTGGPLVPDTYQLSLRSATSGFKNAQAGLLDGNFDSVPGDNYQAMFVASAPAAETVRVSVADFARGFGQEVNVPASASSGLPITVSHAVGVGSVSFTLRYDPALLTISAATLGANINGTLNFNVVSPGVAQISVTNPTGLSSSSGSQTLVNLTAQVPASATYGFKEILDITALQVFDTSVAPVELPGVDDDGIHVAAYLGDANGSQTYNAPDATFTQRIIVGTNTGLAAYQSADPGLIVDINSNGLFQANDVTAIQRAVVGMFGDIPAQPSLPAATAGGPDPLVSIPQNLTASVGESISVPVELLVTEPTGVDLAGADLTIAYDPTALELTSLEIGTLLVGFGMNANTSAPGVIRLSLAGSSPLSLPFDASGVLATLQFIVLPSAGPTTAINLLADDGVLRTAWYDRGGSALTLQPAPSNRADDLVDGRVSIVEHDWANAVDAALAEM